MIAKIIERERQRCIAADHGWTGLHSKTAPLDCALKACYAVRCELIGCHAQGDRKAEGRREVQGRRLTRIGLGSARSASHPSRAALEVQGDLGFRRLIRPSFTDWGHRRRHRVQQG